MLSAWYPFDGVATVRAGGTLTRLTTRSEVANLSLYHLVSRQYVMFAHQRNDKQLHYVETPGAT
jgi:hypothetical protein